MEIKNLDDIVSDFLVNKFQERVITYTTLLKSIETIFNFRDELYDRYESRAINIERYTNIHNYTKNLIEYVCHRNNYMFNFPIDDLIDEVVVKCNITKDSGITNYIEQGYSFIDSYLLEYCPLFFTHLIQDAYCDCIAINESLSYMALENENLYITHDEFGYGYTLTVYEINKLTNKPICEIIQDTVYSNQKKVRKFNENESIMKFLHCLVDCAIKIHTLESCVNGLNGYEYKYDEVNEFLKEYISRIYKSQKPTNIFANIDSYKKNK